MKARAAGSQLAGAAAGITESALVTADSSSIGKGNFLLFYLTCAILSATLVKEVLGRSLKTASLDRDV